MSPLALYHVPVVDAVADIDGAGYAGAPGLAAGAHCRGQALTVSAGAGKAAEPAVGIGARDKKAHVKGHACCGKGGRGERSYSFEYLHLVSPVM